MFKTAIITDELSQDLELACQIAKQYDLSGIELRSVWGKGPHLLSDDEVEEIAKIAKRYELEVCGISAPFFKCEIDNEEEIAQQYEILDRCINLANKTGAKFVRGFTFWSHGRDFDEYFDQIVDRLKAAAKYVEGKGITLVIEMDPTLFACDATKVAKVVKAVNHAQVKGLFDPGNILWVPGAETPYPDGYEAIKDCMVHVHIKDADMVDGKIDAVKIGTGLVDYKGFIARLKEDKYEGYIVLETHYRMKKELSEEQLALPGGADFSDGAIPASTECLPILRDWAK